MIDRTPLVDLKVGESCITTALIREVQVKKTRTQKDYLFFVFVDATGEVSGQAWDIAEIGALQPGQVVKIQASVDEYKGVTQLNVKNIRPYGDGPLDEAVDLADYVPTSPVPPGVLLDLVRNFCKTHASKRMYKFLDFTLKVEEKRLCEAAAAKGIHHAYRGGLLEHVLSLMTAAVPISDHYGLNTDYLLFACLFHDLGKVREMRSNNGVIEYTVEGTVVGHVTIGIEMFNDLLRDYKARQLADYVDFTDEEVLAMKHLIVSHHGQLAWGASKVPATKEAIVFHFLDMIDSRLAIFDNAVKKDNSPGPMTGYISLLETALLK